jgi:uncharacterized protein (DUF2235 family)
VTTSDLPGPGPASTGATAGGGRNLVVCLDGTGNQVKAHGRNTNVVLLYTMLLADQPDRQLIYYDPGVGTFAAAGAWTRAGRAASRVAGLAWGAGMRANLGEAYTWLMRTWVPGDRLYVFGFSRGAYTARALAGMLRTIGLLRPGSENLVPYAVSLYARPGGEDRIDWDPVHEFSAAFAQQIPGPDGRRRSTIPITYLGLWDTVKAAGMLRWDPHWPYTRAIPNAARVRHAVSIDERRRPYAEYLITPTDGNRLEEVWFAGVHSDVGGTFAAPKGTPALSTITLKWVTDAAIAEGLLVRPRKYTALCTLTGEHATASEVHQMGWIWNLATTRTRPIPDGAAVHTSVAARSNAHPDHQPRLPAQHTWADPDWLTPHPPTP